MLTDKRVKAALRHPDIYFDARGLYLEVSTPTAASWVLRFQLNHVEHSMGLGSARDVPLAVARERAREARILARDGINPIADRKRRRAEAALAAARTMDFETAARKYFATNERKWKPKQRVRFAQVLEDFAHPVLGKLPVAAIDTPLVLRAIEPVWAEKVRTADLTRSYIEAILDWAKVHGLREGENPARWKGNLDQVLPAKGEITTVRHHPALPYTRIGAFVAALRAREGVAARALELLILCASRSDEVLGATWAEVDLNARVWTIPAARMKGRREHKVPLSSRAVELLRALPREPHASGATFVFPGREPAKSLSENSMAAVLKRMKVGCDVTITIHGFRSTFRDWAGEVSHYPNHVVEMALAHAIPSAVERAYRRGDLILKRTKLMEDWSSFCDQTTPRSAEVVPLRSAAS